MKAIKLILRAAAHHAIGLMSGTSLDGITAALVRIDERRRRPVKLIASKTYPYALSFRSRLLKASAGASVGAGEISALNFGLGRALGCAALNLARRAAMPLDRLSFIASHGHTMFHLPPRRVRRGEIPSTLQLGEASVIAALTGVPVVADFRPMDASLPQAGRSIAACSRGSCGCHTSDANHRNRPAAKNSAPPILRKSNGGRVH